MFGTTKLTRIEGSTPKTILFCTEGVVSIGIVMSQTGATTVDGRKIHKAGTPVTGNLTNRATEFTKATTTPGKAGNLVVPDGGGTVELPEPKVSNAVGILMNDVDVTNGKANAHIYLCGVIDVNKIDSTTAALITDEVKKALPNLIFVK